MRDIKVNSCSCSHPGKRVVWVTESSAQEFLLRKCLTVSSNNMLKDKRVVFLKSCRSTMQNVIDEQWNANGFYELYKLSLQHLV